MRALYTAADDAKVRQWHSEGVPQAEQARRLGIPKSRLQSWRRRLGLTAGYAPVPPELDTKIKEWAEDGWPLKEVAETSGLPLQQVRQQYPQIQMDPTTQGMLGSAVRTAVRMNPSIMKGLR